MSNRYTKATRLTGTAIMAALVLVFDYALKFSGFKIPFPWLPFLKFDFTGVPISLSYIMYGLPSGGFTSAVACLGIIARSGEVVSSLAKGLSEFSTVLGMALGVRIGGKWSKSFTIILGLVGRIIGTTMINLVVLPNYYGIPSATVVGMLPMLGAFNLIQGGISIFFGYIIFEAYTRRLALTSG